MPDAASLHSLDLILRGAASGVLLLITALVLRVPGRLPAALMGALFAVSGAAYAMATGPGFFDRVGFWTPPIVVFTSGGNVAFWLFARALFEDGFRLRPTHGLLWSAIAAAGLLDGFVLAPHHHPLAAYMAGFLTLETLGFVGLTVAQILATWGGDLVEPRRRLRLYVVAAASAYVGAKALADLVGAPQAAPVATSLTEALGLCLVTAAAALALVRIPAGELLFARPPGAAPPPPPGIAESRLAGALDRAMRVDRSYRRDGLTISALASDLGLTERRLRSLINQGLGYRNFSAFLNSHRVAEAIQALADPNQAQVPILTIAMDTGFASLGPFNRAFKAETGRTPSEFRRSALADSGIDQP